MSFVRFFIFKAGHYEATFNWVDKKGVEQTGLKYELPALIGPHEGELQTPDRFKPLFNVPGIVNAVKLNTVIWSLISGIIILLTRKSHCKKTNWRTIKATD